MRKVFGIGETVYDIIFRDGAPVAARPGGSVLNSLVSLGRAGLPVSFISEYGSDGPGSLIDGFLKANGVDTSTVYRYDDVKTSLALAFLDEKSNAHYEFHKYFPSRRLDVVFPSVAADDILQFGSFFAVLNEIRDRIIELLTLASKSGAFILYDPNFRKSHISELEELRPLIIENMSFATLVRGSDEDFFNICGARDADEAWSFVSRYCRCLVYTASSEGVFVRTDCFRGSFPVKKITPVSTIGAGDNFNAGMIASIYKNGITRDQLAKAGEAWWRTIVETGVSFATEVCLTFDNYISGKFASGVRFIT